MTTLPATPEPGAAYVETVFRRCLEGPSARKKALRVIERVRGPLSLRRLSGLSQSAFAEVLSNFTGRVYGRSRICQWEQPERSRGRLPRGYWKRYGMPEGVVAAMHRLVADLVTWASGGKYHARIRGTRKWTIKLVEVRHG